MLLQRLWSNTAARHAMPCHAMVNLAIPLCFQVFRPMLMIALEQYFQNQVPEVLASLFDALNSADIAGAPRPTPWERALMRRFDI